MSGLRCALSVLAIGFALTLLGLFEPAGELLLVAGAFGAAIALDPGVGREQPRPAPRIGFASGLAPAEWSTRSAVEADTVDDCVV